MRSSTIFWKNVRFEGEKIINWHELKILEWIEHYKKNNGKCTQADKLSLNMTHEDVVNIIFLFKKNVIYMVTKSNDRKISLKWNLSKDWSMNPVVLYEEQTSYFKILPEFFFQKDDFDIIFYQN